MNQEIKQQWLQSLRNGEYIQGAGHLRNPQEGAPSTFCCLGVLCDLYHKSHIDSSKWEESTFIIHPLEGELRSLSSYYLPKRIIKWAGFTSEELADHASSSTDVWVKDEKAPSGRRTLASLNDMGTTFQDIADHI